MKDTGSKNRSRKEIFQVVLESIKDKPKSVNAISKGTGLEWKTVNNAIDLLLDLDAITQKTESIKGKKTHVYLKK